MDRIEEIEGRLASDNKVQSIALLLIEIAKYLRSIAEGMKK